MKIKNLVFTLILLSILFFTCVGGVEAEDLKSIIEWQTTITIDNGRSIAVHWQHSPGSKKYYLWQVFDRPLNRTDLWGIASFVDGQLVQYWDREVWELDSPLTFSARRIELTGDKRPELVVLRQPMATGGGGKLFVFSLKNNKWNLINENFTYTRGASYFDVKYPIDGMYQDLDEDGVMELLVYKNIATSVAHGPAWLDIYQWNGNRFSRVNEKFPQVYQKVGEAFGKVAKEDEHYRDYYLDYLDRVQALTDSGDKIREKDLVGTIGFDLKIHMDLKIVGSFLRGSYYYDKYKTDIRIDGKFTDQNKFSITEYDTADRPNGTFEGIQFSDYYLEGTWSNDESEYPFQAIDEDLLEGKWYIKRYIPKGEDFQLPNKAKGLIGKEIVYSTDQIIFDGEILSNPMYKMKLGSDVTLLGDDISFKEIGINRNTALVILIFDEKGLWLRPGGALIVKDRDTLITLWDGNYFELSKIK